MLAALRRPTAGSLIAAAVLLTACSPSAPSEDTSDVLLWADEFSGPRGDRPDASVWQADVGNLDSDGWGNHELQHYTDSAENAALDGDGNLVITAVPTAADVALPCFTVPSCPYTSARLTTEGTMSLERGRIDVRAQIPNGDGLLPAIWMLGDDSREWPAQGEIDIAEVVGGEPTTVHGTAHGPGYSNEQGIGGATELDGPSSSEFHVYSVEKSPDRIVWLVDGEAFFTLSPSDLPDGAEWVFEQPMHLILNVAVGGDWPGDPSSSTPFPAVMRIDYVRVYGEGVVAESSAPS